MYQSKRTSRKGVTLFTTNGCGAAHEAPRKADPRPERLDSQRPQARSVTGRSRWRSPEIRS